MSEEEQATAPGGADLGSGAMLGRARAERQLSVAEVAERLKYGTRQIEALESDDYSRLPGTTFVRGMIRGYAKLVGLDPEPVLKALERRNIPAQATVDLRPQRIPFPDGHKHGTRLYLMLSLAALLGIVAVLYEWHMADEAPLPASVSVAPPEIKSEPAPAAPAPEDPAPAAAAGPVAQSAPAAAAGAKARSGGAGRIQLEFQKESWVEIKDRVGRTLLSQLNSAGTQRVVEGAPPFSVTIGNAGSVRLQYNDAPVDLRPYVKVEVARLTLE